LAAIKNNDPLRQSTFQNLRKTKENARLKMASQSMQSRRGNFHQDLLYMSKHTSTEGDQQEEQSKARGDGAFTREFARRASPDDTLVGASKMTQKTQQELTSDNIDISCITKNVF